MDPSSVNAHDIELGKGQVTLSLTSKGSQLIMATNTEILSYTAELDTKTVLHAGSAENIHLKDNTLLFSRNCGLFMLDLVTNKVDYLFKSDECINSIDVKRDLVGIATDAGIPLLLDFRMIKSSRDAESDAQPFLLDEAKQFRPPGHLIASEFLFAGNYCVTGGYDCNLKLWDYNRGTCRDRIQMTGDPGVNPPYVNCIADITGLELQSNIKSMEQKQKSKNKDTKLAAGLQNGSIALVNIRNYKFSVESIIEPHSWAVSSLYRLLTRIYSKERNLLVSGSIDRSLIFHSNHKIFHDCGFKVNSLCFLKDSVCAGGTVGSTSEAGKVQILSISYGA